MHESIPNLSDIPWLPLFVAFVASLLLSAKCSIQLLLGKHNHFPFGDNTAAASVAQRQAARGCASAVPE